MKYKGYPSTEHEWNENFLRCRQCMVCHEQAKCDHDGMLLSHACLTLILLRCMFSAYIINSNSSDIRSNNPTGQTIKQVLSSCMDACNLQGMKSNDIWDMFAQCCIILTITYICFEFQSHGNRRSEDYFWEVWRDDEAPVKVSITFYLLTCNQRLNWWFKFHLMALCICP